MTIGECCWQGERGIALQYETVLASLICFHLKSAVCQFHTALVFFYNWREGFTCLTCLHHSPPLMKIKTGTHSKQEPGVRNRSRGHGGTLKISLFSMADSFHCIQPETPFPGVALSTVVGPSHHNQPQSRKRHSSLDYKPTCRRRLLLISQWSFPLPPWFGQADKS